MNLRENNKPEKNVGLDVLDPDRFYKEIAERSESDHELHDSIVANINDILCSKSNEGYEQLGSMIESERYIEAAGYFNDLKEFMYTFAVFSSEVGAGVERTIYDVITSIEDYLGLCHAILYCFRRIQLGHEDAYIEQAYMEFMDRNVSSIFLLSMLKRVSVGDKGYVGTRIAALLQKSERIYDGLVLKGLVSHIFPDEISTVHFERELYSTKQYNKKICFITCVNDDRMYEECLYYISKLIVPEGVLVDSISIKEADSMTSGYNAAMEASDADIKVYLHQDVCILNPYFIIDLLDIFDMDDKISMVGLVGAPKLPEDAVMWHGARFGNLYQSDSKIEFHSDVKSRYTGIGEVEAVDGLLIATGKDVRWREDIFDGWDFYDVSESFEHRRKGFKIVVPYQITPWVIHDDGILNLYSYGKYRSRFIEVYL